MEYVLVDITATFQSSRSIDLLYKRVEKYAYKGWLMLLKAAVVEVIKQNDIYNRITPRHKFFKLVELEELYRKK